MITTQENVKHIKRLTYSNVKQKFKKGNVYKKNLKNSNRGYATQRTHFWKNHAFFIRNYTKKNVENNSPKI